MPRTFEAVQDLQLNTCDEWLAGSRLYEVIERASSGPGGVHRPMPGALSTNEIDAELQAILGATVIGQVSSMYAAPLVRADNPLGWRGCSSRAVYSWPRRVARRCACIRRLDDGTGARVSAQSASL
jgi:hypothetical protein